MSEKLTRTQQKNLERLGGVNPADQHFSRRQFVTQVGGYSAVAGGAVRRADGAVIGSTATSLIGQFKVDYAIIGAYAIDEDGALLDFDYREVQAAQAIIANARSVMLVADSTKLRRSAPVRIAHISQIQTFVTDAALPAGLANICHTRGIEVIEAMPKPAADIDEPGTELPSTVTRLR